MKVNSVGRLFVGVVSDEAALAAKSIVLRERDLTEIIKDFSEGEPPG